MSCLAFNEYVSADFQPRAPAVNLAIIATAGFVVYNNWDKPRWDRRAVTAGVVGLLAIFGAEGALGYYEVEQDKKERGRL